jgi:NAD(P)-dependent dehydrogenase (short-subunit alcohol dehydrogenase family)
MGLDGRHALVTGGSRGIGAAIADVLAQAGARVTVLGRDRTALDEVADRVGGQMVVADVTDAAALATALAEAEGGLGPIDILVNNAGAAESAKFQNADDALWERMLALNLTSVVRATRHVLPGMLDRNWGRIVSVASTAGLKGYAYVSAYSAAKHAVIGLTRSLALETARTGVTVNAVCPGYTDTDLVRGSAAHLAERTGKDPDAPTTPADRPGRSCANGAVAGRSGFRRDDRPGDRGRRRRDYVRMR